MWTAVVFTLNCLFENYELKGKDILFTECFTTYKTFLAKVNYNSGRCAAYLSVIQTINLMAHIINKLVQIRGSHRPLFGMAFL